MTIPESPSARSDPDWRDILLGVHPKLVRYRRFFRHLPSDPRCKMCLSPQGGIGGSIVQLLGYGRYPPNPQLCNACFRNWQQHPGGAEIEITAFFADVRGSTGLAETMAPIEYSKAVNDYVRLASHAIREPGGLVDRLLGDGVMALFIPGFMADANHATSAIEAARRLLRDVALPVGIGVHTGPAWVGFVGGVDDVLDFTALGDAVNVAARLGTEAVAGEVLMSDAAARTAGIPTDELESRRLDLRGRTEPLDAWSERIGARTVPSA